MKQNNTTCELDERTTTRWDIIKFSPITASQQLPFNILFLRSEREMGENFLSNFVNSFHCLGCALVVYHFHSHSDSLTTISLPCPVSLWFIKYLDGADRYNVLPVFPHSLSVEFYITIASEFHPHNGIGNYIRCHERFSMTCTQLIKLFF